jgi:hypothetical protein
MRINLPLLCLITVLATAEKAQASDEVHPFISSKYSIQVGAFLPRKDFKLTVEDTVPGIDREFDFEKATGFSEDDEVFVAEFKWRFGEK